MPPCCITNCIMKDSEALYLCSDTCDRLYHPKCVGHNANIFDTVLRSPGLYWYCGECRKLSLSVLASHMNRVAEDFGKLSKSFVNLSKQLETTHEAFKRIALFPTNVEVTQVADCLNTSLSSDFHNNTSLVPQSRHSMVSDTTDTNSELYKNVTFCKKPKPQSITSTNSTAHSFCPLTSNSSVTRNDTLSGGSHLVTTVPLPISSPLIVNCATVDINGVDVPNNNLIPLLMAVPPLKSIFISRLLLSYSHNDVLLYIKSKLVDHQIRDDLNLIKCKRVTSSGSSVASFKLTVPLSVFDLIMSPTFWPANTLIHEFVVKPRVNGSVFPPTVNAGPKN